MKRMLLKGGRLVDPAAGVDGVFDLIIMGGRVASIKPSAEEAGGEGWDVIGCKGLIVAPGLIDLHVHLREPGEEYKETIKTGTLAAAAGGVTTVVCMANTRPANDSAAVTRFIKKKAEEEGFADVLPAGAVTMDRGGERLTEFGELKDAGCVALTDDGSPVASSSVMRRALEYSKAFGLVIMTHAEDPSLSKGGAMNEGAVSTRLGLRGIPNAAEDVMVARDAELALLTGGRLHVSHVSTAGAVAIIREAKRRGAGITAEVTPHHLTLTDEDVVNYDTDFKMNPPLRTSRDVEALIEGIKDGTIDAIATDHAPHSAVEKEVEFDAAANGITGLETSLALTLMLAEKKGLSISDVIRIMSVNPARIIKEDRGTLRVGSRADAVIIDPNLKWTVDVSKLKSKSKNTPFKGMELKGAAVKTILNGRLVYERER